MRQCERAASTTLVPKQSLLDQLATAETTHRTHVVTVPSKAPRQADIVSARAVTVRAMRRVPELYSLYKP